MDWKTSRTLFERIGLQFFAEGGNDGAADAGDTGETDGFMDGFEDGENQAGLQETQEPEETPEDGQQEGEDGGELQEGEPQDERDTPDTPPAPTMPLIYNGRRTDLPADAVQALTRALGGDVIALLQKGLNYEHRGAREISVLDRYAQAGGYTDRAAYLEAMERQLGEYQVGKELERLQEEYPDTPADALRPVAERLVQDRAAQERQAAGQRAAAQAQADMRRKGEELTRPWQDFLRAFPGVDTKSLPEEFFHLVNAGLHPQAAYEHLRAEQLSQEKKNLEEQIKANQKNEQNRQQAAGSMQSEGIRGDSFLSGFLLN